MNFGLNAGASEQLDALLGRLDRLTAAVEANTAAIVEANAQRDFELNGPRG